MLVGKAGEEIATVFLKELGYQIIDRNVRIGSDEIDIIARDPEDEVVVFAEVKTRTRFSEDFLPSSNAGFRKWKRLRRAGARWMYEQNSDDGWRMDLISVAEGRVIDHTKEIGSWY